ncbi:MurR/RpiR family transcriptional regulator [Lacrimispora indolis]|uniref:MurR/RpiR family transcriptional regulator n=1 Tax=Lacrimispora indolis TaxID=69825 RepID=UPI00045E6F07|nr:MurR/RpiR family transcriptional regulator [Lacrimispora indolis]
MDFPNTGYQLRVQSILAEITKNEKKIYEFIENNRRDIIHMSVADAAEACEVSEPTIVRYAQKLGYKGYQAMKISIAQESIEPEQQIYGHLAKDDTISTIVNKIIDSNIQSLKDTSDVLNRESIDDAVNLILGCRRLLFFGVGGSGCIALDGQHKFIKIGYLAMAFSDSNLQAMAASVLTPKDVVVAISHSGASKDILMALEIARNSGARTIAITNYGRSPIVDSAEVVLFTSSNETAFNSDALSSRIAELSIIDMLYIGVSYKRYDESYAEILKTRKALDATKI